MGTNEKLVPGELLKISTMPLELNVWVEQNFKNKITARNFCQTKNINEEIT